MKAVKAWAVVSLISNRIHELRFSPPLRSERRGYKDADFKVVRVLITELKVKKGGRK